MNKMKNIYWLTGLPSSGKSTIGKELARHLYAPLLDGDEIRKIRGDTDFSLEGRTAHMKFVAYLANLFSSYTESVVALVSPIRAIREEIKSQYPNVREVYVKCDPEVYKKRDTKGMWARAFNGEIPNFTGVQQEYEEPLTPDVTIESDKYPLEQCVDKILELHDYTRMGVEPGRFQPWHNGHKWVAEQIMERGHKPLIMIRLTPIDENNPYSAEERIKMVQEEMGDKVEIMVLPYDIAGIYCGRTPGFEMLQYNPPQEIENISATNIRKQEGGNRHD